MNKVELMPEQYALQALISAGHVKATDFTNDMAHKPRYTDKQKQWVHKLVAEGNQAAEAAKSVADIGTAPKAVHRVLEFIKAATGPKLKKPSVRVLTDAAGGYITFAKVADDAKDKFTGKPHPNRGYVYMYLTNRGYMGKISPEGVISVKFEVPEDAKAAIVRFAIDPWQEVRAFAKAHGRCCFCDASLFDAKGYSQLWGYGPVCAKHYGLPHGNYHKKVGTADNFPTEFIPVDWRPIETVPEDFYSF